MKIPTLRSDRCSSNEPKIVAQRFITVVAAVVAGFLIVGCVTNDARRINADVIAQATPEQQEMIKRGKVAVGFNKEMVRAALGGPNLVQESTEYPNSEVWSYRPIYEKVCDELHKSYPVYFYAIGRPQGQPADALFDKIKSVILSSTAAIFDASRGNANVSLEFGLAHFVPGLQQFLLIDQNAMPTHVNVGTPIVSDLAGATQNRWDLAKVDTLKQHLKAIAENHEYTKRFRKYCRSRKLVKGQFRTPLKVIRMFDERDSMLRRELVDQLQVAWPGKPEKKISELVRDLHDAGLITVTKGREWASRVTVA